MSKDLLNCKIPGWEDRHWKASEYDPNMPADSRKHLDRLHELWVLANPDKFDNLAVQTNVGKFFERAKRVGGIVGASTYDTNFYNKLQGGFVNTLVDKIQLGVLRKEGNIHDYVSNMGREASGYVLDQLEKLEVGKKAQVFDLKTKEILKKRDITGVDVANVKMRLYETMSQPYLIEYTLGSNPAGQKLLTKRAKQSAEYFESIGLTKADIEQLSVYANDLQQSMHEVASVGRTVGLNVETLTNMGYFPRILTPEALNIIEMSAKKGEDALDFGVDIVKDPKAWFENSRNYSILVPSDINTLDYLFQKNGVFDRLNSLSSKDTGYRTIKQIKDERKIKNFTSVRQMLEDGTEPVLLGSIFNQLNTDEMDFLVQSGLIAKIPIETETLYKKLHDIYKLPFDGLDDVFRVDAEQGVVAYKTALSKVATEKGKIYGTIKGAMDSWGVPKELTIGNTKYKNYVPLSKAFPDKILKNLEVDTAITRQLNNIYIHPRMQKYMESSFRIHTDPKILGEFGHTLALINKSTIGAMLGTLRYFNRQLVQVGTQVMSYGVSPSTYLRNLTQIFGQKVWNMKHALQGNPTKSVREYLTDKKVWASGTVSPREAWEKAERHGLLNGSTMFGDKTSLKKVDMRSLKRTWNELQWMRKNYPDEVNLNYLLGKSNAGFEQVLDNTLFLEIHLANEISDNAAKFSLLQTILTPKQPWDVFRELPYIPDVDKAVQYAKTQYFMFDDLPHSKGLYGVATTMFPFLGFQWKSFQQTGRYLVEHPNRFASYLSLVGQYKEQFKEEHPEETHAMVAPWRNQFSPSLPFVVPSRFTDTGRDEYFNFPVDDYLFQFSSLEDVNMMMDTLGLFNSSKVPSERSDNPVADSNDALKLRELFLDRASPVINLAVSHFLTNETKYGVPMDSIEGSTSKKTILGVEVSPMTYYNVTQVFPAIKNYDDLFSFSGLGGSADFTDPTTGKFTQGTPSWTGVVPGTPTASQNPFGLKSFGAELLGIMPEHVDVYYQLGQRKRVNLQIQLSKMEKEIKSLYYKLGKDSLDETQKQGIREEREKIKLFHWAVSTELEIVDRWADLQGIPSTRALDQIIDQQRSIPDLLPKSEVDKISKEMYDKYNNNPWWR